MPLHTFVACIFVFCSLLLLLLLVAVAVAAVVTVAGAGSRKHFKCHFNYICSFVRLVGRKFHLALSLGIVSKFFN